MNLVHSSKRMNLEAWKTTEYNEGGCWQNLLFGGEQIALQLVGVSLSNAKIKQPFHEYKHRGFTTRCKPVGTSNNRKDRFYFARKHLKRPHEFWNQILRTDETKINLNQNHGGRKVWRRKWRVGHPKQQIMCGGHIMGWAHWCLLMMWPPEESGWILRRIGLYSLFISSQIQNNDHKLRKQVKAKSAFHLLKAERITNKQRVKVAVVTAWQSISSELSQN